MVRVLLDKNLTKPKSLETRMFSPAENINVGGTGTADGS